MHVLHLNLEAQIIFKKSPTSPIPTNSHFPYGGLHFLKVEGALGVQSTHSSYGRASEGKARGPEKSDSSSRARTAQRAGAGQRSEQQVLACRPCQTQAAGCQGSAGWLRANKSPAPRDCELGRTLGMNSEYADVVKLSEREATGLGNMNAILSVLEGGKEDFENTG